MCARYPNDGRPVISITHLTLGQLSLVIDLEERGTTVERVDVASIPAAWFRLVQPFDWRVSPRRSSTEVYRPL